MHPIIRVSCACAALAGTPAGGQTPPGRFGDLDPSTRVVLSKAQREELLPGARLRRISGGGNTQYWTNGPDGQPSVFSDGNFQWHIGTTRPGRWRISEDGRYCVAFEWKSVPEERWRRFIVRSGDVFYGVASERDDEGLHHLSISK